MITIFIENKKGMALVLNPEFRYCIRLMNTVIDGRQNVVFAMTTIKGCGRRYSKIVCKRAGVDLTKRAGELSDDELDRIVTVMTNPLQYKIPVWYLNRKKDVKDGKNSHALSNRYEQKMREDLGRLKRIKAHRGLRHHWGLRVRGQKTKSNARRGRSVGFSKKKK